MADVTDAAFRHIIAKYGKPDVMWTEFVSADGLALAPEEGKRKLKDGEEREKKPYGKRRYFAEEKSLRI